MKHLWGVCHREASNSGGADMHKLFKKDQKQDVQKKGKQNRLCLYLFLSAALLSFIMLTSCTMDPNSLMNIYFPGDDGASVTLEWDSNDEPMLAGYIIYYGTSSGLYEKSIDVGNLNAFTVRGLEYNTTYFFSATAYNVYGGESDFADEIIFFISDQGGTSI